MQAYATKTEKISSKSVLKEEQQGFEPEPSGIINLAGGGRSLDLPDTLRSRVRTQFGLNMDSLRVKESAQVADLGANAMAQGNIISFAPGVFNPNTSSGQEIIGHELHHITEQARGLGSNIEGSNIHYNPSSESASDAAGRAFATGFAQGEGAGFAPSVTPVAASAAPVQGKGIRSFLSKIFGQKRRQRQNQVPGDQPGGQPGVQPGGQSGDQLGVQPDPGQSGLPLPPEQSDQPVPPEQSDIPNQPDPQGSAPLPVNQPPVTESADDKKLNDDIYAMEENFLPSPNSGIFKEAVLDKEIDLSSWSKLFQSDNKIGGVEYRKKNKIKHGMSKNEIVKREIDETKRTKNTHYKDWEILRQFYSAEGKDKDLFAAKKDGGINNEIEMTFHADAKNDKYSEIRQKRELTNLTYLFNSNLREFIRKNKEKRIGKKESNALFGREVYRSIILDVMEGRDDVNGKYSRKALEAIYEKLHIIKKNEEKEKMSPNDERRKKSSATGLDVHMDLLPDVKYFSKDQKDEYDKMEDAMNRLMSSECGHSWIETNSYDAGKKHRVRFTMGFWPDGESKSLDPFQKQPGMVMNPDSNDNKVGSSSRTDKITRKDYLKALKFAINFKKDFHLTGIPPGTANCTTFASGMANAAGMKVQSSKRMIPGTIYAPDFAANDTEMKKTSKSDYELGNEQYRAVSIPKEANINDSKAGELLMEACQKNKKYITVFGTLEEEEKFKGDIVLREKLLESFRKGASGTKQAFILTALHNFNKNGVVPDTLEIFIDMTVDKVAPDLKDEHKTDKLVKTLGEVSKAKPYVQKLFTKHQMQGKNPPKTTAKTLHPMLSGMKEDLLQEFIHQGFLDKKWLDPQRYAEPFLRALTIALEMHLPVMIRLRELFEGTLNTPDKIGDMINIMKSKQTLIDEVNRLFLVYTGSDYNKSAAYDSMYFLDRNE